MIDHNNLQEICLFWDCISVIDCFNWCNRHFNWFRWHFLSEIFQIEALPNCRTMWRFFSGVTSAIRLCVMIVCPIGCPLFRIYAFSLNWSEVKKVWKSSSGFGWCFVLILVEQNYHDANKIFLTWTRAPQS